jgi:hypothetical protein
LNEQHIVGVDLAVVFGAVHARRADRHARHRQAERPRPLAQQPPDLARGNMALDHVAGDDGGVAGAEFLRHAEASAVVARFRHIGRLDLEAVGLQVPDPVVAAAASRRLVDLDLSGGHRLCQRRGGERGQQRNDGPAAAKTGGHR